MKKKNPSNPYDRRLRETGTMRRPLGSENEKATTGPGNDKIGRGMVANEAVDLDTW